MPTISENGLLTVFAEFDVDPAVQRQLIDQIADTVAETTMHHDGFVSTSFHARVDGRRVVNYAQWTSREAWERATAMSADDTSDHRGDDWLEQQSRHNPVAAIMRRLGAGSRSVQVFHVERIVEAP
jgi:hypothetical protein